MKRALFATAAAVGLCLIPGPRPARALLGVGDICANCTQEATEIIREIKRAAEVAKMVQTGVQQVQIATNTYRAFTNIHDLGSAVGAFGMLGIHNPLPISPYAMQSLLNGTGGTQGMIGSLSGLYTGTTSANTRFQVPLTHWVGEFLTEQVAAISGSQAASLQLHQSAAERADHIASLQAQIAANAGNPSVQASLANQLAAYQAQTQNQAVQAVALANYSAQRREAAELIQEQRLQQNIDAVLQEARSRGWW